MRDVSKVVRRPLLTAGVAALVLGGAWSGVALAGAPYTVAVNVVPSTAPIPGSFKVTASGLSSNLSRLKVFLNATKACAPTAAGEAALAGDILVINPPAGVVGAYSRSKTLITVAGAKGPRGEGNHQACAYLIAAPPAALLRARASTAYSVG
ncbi:MAG: hypothetical protein ABSG64_13695 [Solirubrobacteraceae bacterium]